MCWQSLIVGAIVVTIISSVAAAATEDRNAEAIGALTSGTFCGWLMAGSALFAGVGGLGTITAGLVLTFPIAAIIGRWDYQEQVMMRGVLSFAAYVIVTTLIGIIYATSPSETVRSLMLLPMRPFSTVLSTLGVSC